MNVCMYAYISTYVYVYVSLFLYVRMKYSMAHVAVVLRSVKAGLRMKQSMALFNVEKKAGYT